jgi:hypothetical protein
VQSDGRLIMIAWVRMTFLYYNKKYLYLYSSTSSACTAAINNQPNTQYPILQIQLQVQMQVTSLTCTCSCRVYYFITSSVTSTSNSTMEYLNNDIIVLVFHVLLLVQVQSPAWHYWLLLSKNVMLLLNLTRSNRQVNILFNTNICCKKLKTIIMSQQHSVASSRPLLIASCWQNELNFLYTCALTQCKDITHPLIDFFSISSSSGAYTLCWPSIHKLGNR